jgi:hypothetical protein
MPGLFIVWVVFSCAGDLRGHLWLNWASRNDAFGQPPSFCVSYLLLCTENQTDATDIHNARQDALGILGPMFWPLTIGSVMPILNKEGSRLPSQKQHHLT